MMKNPAAIAAPGALSLALVTTVALAVSPAAPAATITFEDLSPSRPYAGPGGGFFENGAEASGGMLGTFDGSFASGGATFANTYTAGQGFDFWGGFAYSTTSDTTTPGFGNQYSALPGAGAGGSATYALGFGDGASILLPTGSRPVSLEITNTTYTGLSMENGDAFAKKFGGVAGTDPDFYSVIISGFAGGLATGSTEFFLADYRFADPGDDTIIDSWQTVDLSPLGTADEIRFSFTSSDVNAQGGFINTPTYFALDNLEIAPVPEPSVLGLAGFVGALALGRRRR